MVPVHPTYFFLLAWIAPLYGMFVGERNWLLTLLYLSLPMLIVLIAVVLPTRGGLQRKSTLLILVFGGASLAVAIIQGKGWRYHALPVLVATLLAWGSPFEASVSGSLAGA